MSDKKDTLTDWVVECGCGGLIGAAIAIIIIIILGLIG